MRKGFTLVELAIVLVVIGIVIGIGVTAISSLTTSAKDQETKTLIIRLVNAIQGKVITTGSATCDFDALGVRYDAYGNNLYCIYDATINASNLCDPATTTNITVNVCKDPNCSDVDTFSNVLFLVLSKGANYNLQADLGNNNLEGTFYLAVSTPLTVNIYVSGDVDGYPYDVNRVEFADDPFEIRTLAEVQGKACSGTISGSGTSASCAPLSVRNSTGLTLCYSYDQTNLNLWSNGTDVFLNSGQTLYIYRAFSFGPFTFCSSQCSGVGYDYNTLLSFDTNSNCAVQVVSVSSTSCSFTDL